MENMDRALKRHRLVWRLLYYPLLLLAKLLYNYSFIEAPHIEGSYIVLPIMPTAGTIILSASALKCATCIF
jgi:hypothetical protein